MGIVPELETPNFCNLCGSPMIPKTVDGHRRPVCMGCGNIFWLDPKVVVAAVVPIDGKLLLGRRRRGLGKGLWSFPSGYAERGEALEQTARREVWEETGLDVKPEKLVGVYSAEGNPVVLVVYNTSVIGGNMAPGREMSELGLFTSDSLPPMAFTGDAQVVADWLAQGNANPQT